MLTACVRVGLPAGARGEGPVESLRAVVKGVKIGGNIALDEDDSSFFCAAVGDDTASGDAREIQVLPKTRADHGEAGHGNAWVGGEIATCAVVLGMGLSATRCAPSAKIW